MTLHPHADECDCLLGLTDEFPLCRKCGSRHRPPAECWTPSAAIEGVDYIELPAMQHNTESPGKARLQDVPPALMYAAARALAEDEHVGRKPFDWRGQKTSVMRHLGGILRHLSAYLDGEDVDPESPTGKTH